MEVHEMGVVCLAKD
jgi:hypothetical protein